MNIQTKQVRPNGEAMAALIAAMLGILVLSVSALLAELSEPAKNFIFSMGKFWMPGAERIGPYSGKETIGLMGWIIGWVFLHKVMKGKELKQGFWIFLFLFGIGVATTFVWPPFWTLFHKG